MTKAIDKRTTRSQSNSDRNLNDTQKLRATIRRALPPILQKLYEMALEGDTTAAKILMDRALPALAPVKEPVAFSGDTQKAKVLDILDKVAAGQVAAGDALALFEVLKAAPVERGDEMKKNRGISAETAQMIRREILGIVE